MKSSKSQITLLGIAVACCMPMAAAEKATDLFAQGDFSQWTQINGDPVAEGWQIKDGVIALVGGNPGDIITKENYQNFVLTFEWKISEAGNSGIKYRSRERLGLEYQVLDDEKHADGADADHRSGSLYDLVAAPDDKPVKPVGKWNKGKIVVDGNKVEHWLNGKKLLEIEIGSADWNKVFAASKYKKNEGFGTWTGPILLQDHGDKVWFRKISITRL